MFDKSIISIHADVSGKKYPGITPVLGFLHASVFFHLDIFKDEQMQFSVSPCTLLRYKRWRNWAESKPPCFLTLLTRVGG